MSNVSPDERQINTIHDFLARFQHVTPAGPGKWRARCPCHDDRVASLSISLSDDGRKILVCCHAGCTVARIVITVGLTMRDLDLSGDSNTHGACKEDAERANGCSERRKATAPIRSIEPDRIWTLDAIRGWSSYVAHYMYETADGQPTYLVVRMRERDGGKRFAQYHPAPGGWARGLAGTPRTLYHLPRVVAGIAAGQQIYVVEGEKDVHSLEALGLVATSSSAGAGKWEQRYGALLRGASGIVVIPDADEPGRKHAAAIVASTLAEGIPTRLLELPGVAEKGDVSDWIAAGGTREALEALVAAVEPLTAPDPADAMSELNRTDVGNASRLVRGYGDRIRYCVGLGWLVWDGRRWRRDGEGLVVERAKATARGILCEAASVEDQDARKHLAAWSLKSESASRIRAMVDLARSDPGVVVRTDQLDAQPWLLTCSNGTVDLRDGSVRAHDPEDLITRLTPVDYDPAASAPRWAAFLREIFDDGSRDDSRIDELVAYLQRAIGHSVTGSTEEQVLWICHGKGANGKSTLLEAIRETIGDYCMHTGSSTFTAQKGDRARNDIARLHGSRIVTAIELDDGRKLDEELVKQITGSDPVTCRFLFREEFEYRPTFHLWIAANHRPRIHGTDHAIWRRIHLVPFTRTFTEETSDQQLAETLRSERNGILAWIVAGARSWHERRLAPPAEVLAATREYREESDLLGEFIEERCVVHPRARIDRARLYAEYRQWTDGRGEKLMTTTGFSRKVGERDGIGRTRSGSARGWSGIGLKGEPAPADEAEF